MDLFTYNLEIKKIEEFKTLKAKDEAIRKYITEVRMLCDKRYSWSSYIIDNSNIKEASLLYKCIKKVLQNYSTDRLPVYIADNIRILHIGLANTHVKLNTSYTIFNDTFEFDKVVEIGCIQPKALISLFNIYKTTMPTFIMNMSIDIPTKFTTIFDGIHGTPDIASRVLYLEHVKVLFNGAEIPLLEQYLAECYTENSTNPAKISKAVTTLNIQINTLTNIIKVKCDGQV